MKSLKRVMRIIWFKAMAALGAFTLLSEPAAAFVKIFEQKEVITACLVLEAGGEGVSGMQAVMNVIQNRSRGNSNRYFAEATREKQFSCLNSVNGLSFKDYLPVVIKAKQSRSWVLAKDLVGRAFQKQLADLTNGATHYYAIKNKAPGWSVEMDETAIIKGHRFMRLATAD